MSTDRVFLLFMIVSACILAGLSLLIPAVRSAGMPGFVYLLGASLLFDLAMLSIGLSRGWAPLTSAGRFTGFIVAASLFIGLEILVLPPPAPAPPATGS